MSRTRIATILLLTLLWTTPANGQVDIQSATLKGKVSDPNGAVIQDAVVTVKNPATGLTRSVKSAADGTYQITLLPPGAYRVEVQGQGFNKAVAEHIDLTVGQVAIYDAHMTVGLVTNEVLVTSGEALIQVEQTQQANTVNEAQVENLPNITRNFTGSVFTLPGVSSSSAPVAQNQAAFTGFGTSGFSIGGSNGRNNLVTVDGGENEYGSGSLRTALSIEDVQEFQVNRNSFAAEFGFTAGTAVNVITRAGTNQFHGSAYAFFRDQHTEARNFFEFVPGQPGQKAYDQNFFPGGTFGGPLIKDKLFFFTSYEYTKLDTAQFRDYLNPNQFPQILGVNGSDLADQAQAKYLSLLTASGVPLFQQVAAGLHATLQPLAFPSTVKLLTENNGNFTDRSRLNFWNTRFDYRPGTNDDLSFRFSLNHNDTTIFGNNQSIAPSEATTLFYRDYGLLGTWTHTIGSELANQFRVQVVPQNSAQTVPTTPNTAELLITGIATFQNSFQAPYHAVQNRYEFEDALSWTRRTHTLKFGISYRPVDYRVQNDLWFSGEFDFDGVFPINGLVPVALQPALGAFSSAAGFGPGGPPLTGIEEFSLGLPTLFRQGFGNPVWQDWAHYLGVFAQDSWKVSPNLTLNYGGRIDYDAEPVPLQHNVYFSPRLGFAWDPWGDQKTVIRGGGGIFVSPVYFQVPYIVNLLNDSGKFINQVAEVLPNPLPIALWGLGVQEGKLPFGSLNASDLAKFGIVPGPGANGRVIFDASPNYKNNYSIQASLSVARQISHDVSLELGYNLYRGVHIQLDQETNFAASGVVNPIVGPIYTAINPTITQNNTYSSIGNSIYHGLTVSLTKRYTNYFQFGVNYTFSKAIDDATDFNSAFASFFPSQLFLERALSTFNITHNFVANAVYTTPFKPGDGGNFLARALADVTISPIISIRSGIPFSLTFPGLTNGTLGHNLYARPFYVGRNTGIGPSYASVDMRINKSFYIRRESGVKVDFIAEGTNLFNRSNFSSVNNVFPGTTTNPTQFMLTGPFNPTGSKDIGAGSPLGFSSAFSARQIQFGLRLAF